MINGIERNKKKVETIDEQLHGYLGAGQHLQDEITCHEATKYADNVQQPLAMSSCPGKIPSSR